MMENLTALDTHLLKQSCDAQDMDLDFIKTKETDLKNFCSNPCLPRAESLEQPFELLSVKWHCPPGMLGTYSWEKLAP